MRVLVTGATGFFGGAIFRHLEMAGHDVVGASRSPDGLYGTISLDVADRNACREVMKSGCFDAVVHAAALAHVRPSSVDQIKCREINAMGAGNVAQAARDFGVKRYVFISSVMVYGDFDLPDVVDETTPLLSTDIYGLAKIQGENASLSVAGEMEVSILRMASMYSDDWLFNVRKRVIPPMIGRWVYFSLDGLAPRYSLCSGRLGVAAVARVLDGSLTSGIYNVADDHVYSQDEIRHAVMRVEGIRPVITVPIILPNMLLRFAQAVMPGGSRVDRSRSRYWKFCKRNVYSSRKLTRAGIQAPPDLLNLQE